MVMTEIPANTKEPRQKSIGLSDVYLTRYMTPWSRPNGVISAAAWRWWVYNQPIAMICRETLIANILALDWEIVARESDQRDELKYVIRHYTRLLEKGGDYPEFSLDWTGLIEWIMTDLQDLPFGGAAEIGRRNDSPTGRVLWIKPLDGGTLYPISNRDYPVVQQYGENLVTFPKHSIARTYMSPRPELLQEGWGLAPPEKVYLALVMLYRGDKYYADLLLDSPPAGILDLGDMEKDSAMEWVEAFREFVAGSPSSFKIPVLYEHTTDVKYLPFGKVPNDIMFDRITLKYAAIVTAAYGMSLSDIGLQAASSSGQTLAGSIRDERKTRRTGLARIKKKIKYWLESFLPETLEFNFIDLEGELNIELGRARLANATAAKINIETGQFSREEMRLQQMNDGIITINLPEKPPEDAIPPTGKSEDRPGLLGYPQGASSGGQGEIKLSTIQTDKSKHFDSHLKRFVGDVTKSIGQVLEDAKQGLGEDDLFKLRSVVDDSLFGQDDVLGLMEIIRGMWEGKRWFKVTSEGLADELAELAESQLASHLETKATYQYENGEIEDIEEWKSQFEVLNEKLHRVDWNKLAGDFESALDDSVKHFIGKSSVFILKDLLLSEEDIFDNDSEEGYDIVDKVFTSLSGHFDEFVDACISIETNSLIENMIEEIVK